MRQLKFLRSCVDEFYALPEATRPKALELFEEVRLNAVQGLDGEVRVSRAAGDPELWLYYALFDNVVVCVEIGFTDAS